MEILGDLRQLWGQPWSECALVLCSFVCGAIVGVERERQSKPAGLRTLILICVGSTIFTIASVSPPLSGGQPGRVAAQIVAGVGFLGAGAIMRDSLTVKGLTTAASIWATSAVGIVVGAGYALPGVALSICILLTLSVLSRSERALGSRCDRAQVLVIYRAEQGKTRPRLQRVVDDFEGSHVLGPERPSRDGLCEATLEYCTLHRDHRGVLAKVAELEGVEALAAAP